nr:uncharacterized protein LOC131796180 [Pocillopora verrucosa]
MTELRQELEKEKATNQLLEDQISALKVKESEDCYAEKNDRIRELEEKLATASQNITDCEQSIQHYQLKLAKAEYELETTVARLTHLEKQNTTNAMDSTEVENLRKECESAKKKPRTIFRDTLSRSRRCNYPQSARCKKIQEEMEALQFELAQKNMQIQSLQYDLYKLKEKYDNETKLLKNEVEWGLEKVGSLKLEMKRLKEPETDDTISIMR